MFRIWSTCSRAGAGATLGDETRTLLVPRQDVDQARVRERTIQRQQRTAGDADDMRQPLGFEVAGDQFSTVEVHGGFPS